MNRLILLRHGQSEWNKKNIFTGWIDIPLSREGMQEAIAAGKALRGLPIDLIYTSTLVRSLMTVMLAMSEYTEEKICVVEHKGEGKLDTWSTCYNSKRIEELLPVRCAWQLNERMYGQLQGQNKDEMRERFGKEQVQLWRRSFDIAPPEGESLKMTAERTLPYFDEEILPKLQEGKNILIAAHGNSLRSIVMELDQLSEQEVLALEIPTGRPILYSYNKGQWKRDALL
jgi:2,3-bisphosphoglycerate-dependent phosphoglycerate mutase